MTDKMPAATTITAVDTAGGGDKTRLIAPRYLLTQRLKYVFLAWAWEALLLTPMFMMSEGKKYFKPRAEKEPDLIKTYPARKKLPVRIFFPPNHSPTSTSKLPLLLTIHGGGFVVGSPHDNDSWNRAFAKRHSFLVIALNYSKAPASPFPTAIYDIQALIDCILSEPTLPIDTSRVALAGWSAGGNLTLAAGQLPSLRTRIHAAIPLYPAVDFVLSEDVKVRGRPYKPDLGGFRGRPSDFLLMMTGIFNWAYLTPGQRCDDPLLSPFYASRDELPKNIFTIAVEMDMLAPESQRMACKLAGRRVPGVEEVVGCAETVGMGVLITEGDERFAWETKTDDGGNYKWLLVPDTVHGFDQDNMVGLTGGDEAFLEDARIKTAKVIDMVGDWLLKGPLKPSSS